MFFTLFHRLTFGMVKNAAMCQQKAEKKTVTCRLEITGFARVFLTKEMHSPCLSGLNNTHTHCEKLNVNLTSIPYSWQNIQWLIVQGLVRRVYSKRPVLLLMLGLIQIRQLDKSKGQIIFSNADSILVIQQWIRSLPSQDYWGGHDSFPQGSQWGVL